MRIDLPASGTATSRALNVAQATSSWTVGQLVELKVVSRIDAQTVRLEAGGQTLLARTDLPLSPGTVLQAKVTATGPQPQLTVSLPPGQASPEMLVASALSRALPLQAPLRETLPTLMSSLQSPGSAAALPPEVRAYAAELLATMPEISTLARPGLLAKALEDSGTVLESRLAQVLKDGPAPQLPVDDRKWQLLTLRQAVSGALARLGSPSPANEPSTNLASPVTTGFPIGTRGLGQGTEPDVPAGQAAAGLDRAGGTSTAAVLEGMLSDIDASLARLTSHQLQSANASFQHQTVGFFELPLRPDQGRESVLLEFESEGSRRAESEQAPCSIRLELPLGELGVFRAQINLHGERVAVSTWSDSPRLRELISPRLAELDQALEAHGFALLPAVLRKVEAPNAIRPGVQPLIDTTA